MRRLMPFIIFSFIAGSIEARVVLQKPNELLHQLTKNKSDDGRYLKRTRELNKKNYVAGFKYMINICFASIDYRRHRDCNPKSLFLPLIADCHNTGNKPNEMSACEYLAYFINPDDTSNSFRLICYQNVMSLAGQINQGDDEFILKSSETKELYV